MPRDGSEGTAAITKEMTVAHVRTPPAGAHMEVLFLESARPYRLPTTHPAFARLLALLRRGITTRRPLNVRIASADSDVILDVEE